MGFLDRLRRSGRPTDPPVPAGAAPSSASPPDVGEAAFAGFRELVHRGADVDAQRAEIERVLLAHRVPAPLVARFLAGMVECVALLPAADGDGTPVGARLGGDAVLPDGAAWPVNSHGSPLRLVAVVDLATVPGPTPLPAEGTLVVHWDHEYFEHEPMDFVDATHVRLLPPGGPTSSPAPPDDASRFGPIPLRPVTTILPSDTDALEDDAIPSDVPAWDLLDALLGVCPYQLLGPSRDIQGPVLDEVAYWFEHALTSTTERFDAAELAGEGWMLLAQFDEADGLEFGDAGALYLLIPEADLAAARFDRVMGVMQCH
ncbi:DUF1963 domain-containing protein [Patulibacter minatonensis]|uniref:DUF1963 domain-containing protein n=1 Tax=Patulibacter minatonensis TaxID=298163 RepID=UPI00047DCF05|nr:YwqG family protein [Patulibacter minatonensis]